MFVTKCASVSHIKYFSANNGISFSTQEEKFHKFECVGILYTDYREKGILRKFYACISKY